MAQTQAERGALEQRERELEQQLAAQRSSDAETEKELARVRDRLAELEQAASDEQRGNANQRELKVIAFNLAPQTRGIGQIPTLAVPVGTDYVALTLELETDAFTAFRAVLKNPGTGQIVWQSGNLRSGAKYRTLRVRLPASLLNAQNYVVELSGVSSGGVAEMVSSYSFRVLPQ
jgi:septal ring factor EnvC (AmiA/AmiB activator)